MASQWLSMSPLTLIIVLPDFRPPHVPFEQDPCSCTSDVCSADGGAGAGGECWEVTLKPADLAGCPPPRRDRSVDGQSPSCLRCGSCIRASWQVSGRDTLQAWLLT